MVTRAAERRAAGLLAGALPADLWVEILRYLPSSDIRAALCATKIFANNAGALSWPLAPRLGQQQSPQHGCWPLAQGRLHPAQPCHPAPHRPARPAHAGPIWKSACLCRWPSISVPDSDVTPDAGYWRARFDFAETLDLERIALENPDEVWARQKVVTAHHRTVLAEWLFEAS